MWSSHQSFVQQVFLLSQNRIDEPELPQPAALAGSPLQPAASADKEPLLAQIKSQVFLSSIYVSFQRASAETQRLKEDGIAARILAKSGHDRKSILEIVDEFLSKQHEMFAVHCAVMGDERVLTLAPHLNNVLHVARNHSKSCGQDLISVEHLMLALYADDRFGLPFYRRLQLNETDLKDAFPRVRRGEGSTDRATRASCNRFSFYLKTALMSQSYHSQLLRQVLHYSQLLLQVLHYSENLQKQLAVVTFIFNLAPLLTRLQLNETDLKDAFPRVRRGEGSADRATRASCNRFSFYLKTALMSQSYHSQLLRQVLHYSQLLLQVLHYSENLQKQLAVVAFIFNLAPLLTFQRASAETQRLKAKVLSYLQASRVFSSNLAPFVYTHQSHFNGRARISATALTRLSSELLSSYSSSSESSNPGKDVEDGIAARILAKSGHDRKSILEIVDEFLSKQHEMFAVHCAVMGDERVLTLAPHVNNVLHVTRNHSKSCGQDLISVEHLMLALYADDRFGLPFYRRLQLNETDLKDAFPRVRRGEGSTDRATRASCNRFSFYLKTALMSQSYHSQLLRQVLHYSQLLLQVLHYSENLQKQLAVVAFIFNLAPLLTFQRASAETQRLKAKVLSYLQASRVFSSNLAPFVYTHQSHFNGRARISATALTRLSSELLSSYSSSSESSNPGKDVEDGIAARILAKSGHDRKSILEIVDEFLSKQHEMFAVHCAVMGDERVLTLAPHVNNVLHVTRNHSKSCGQDLISVEHLMLALYADDRFGLPFYRRLQLNETDLKDAFPRVRRGEGSTDRATRASCNRFSFYLKTALMSQSYHSQLLRQVLHYSQLLLQVLHYSENLQKQLAVVAFIFNLAPLLTFQRASAETQRLKAKVLSYLQASRVFSSNLAPFVYTHQSHFNGKARISATALTRLSSELLSSYSSSSESSNPGKDVEDGIAARILAKSGHDRKSILEIVDEFLSKQHEMFAVHCAVMGDERVLTLAPHVNNVLHVTRNHSKSCGQDLISVEHLMLALYADDRFGLPFYRRLQLNETDLKDAFPRVRRGEGSTDRATRASCNRFSFYLKTALMSQSYHSQLLRQVLHYSQLLLQVLHYSENLQKQLAVVAFIFNLAPLLTFQRASAETQRLKAKVLSYLQASRVFSSNLAPFVYTHQSHFNGRARISATALTRLSSELLSSYSSSSESSNPGKDVEDGIAARILAKSGHDRKSILEIVDEFLSKQHEMFAVHCAVMGDERVLTLAPYVNNVLHVTRNHSKSCGQDLISVEHLMLALYADDRFGLPFYRRLQLNETDLKDAFPRVRRGEGSTDRATRASCNRFSFYLKTALMSQSYHSQLLRQVLHYSQLLLQVLHYSENLQKQLAVVAFIFNLAPLLTFQRASAETQRLKAKVLSYLQASRVFPSNLAPFVYTHQSHFNGRARISATALTRLSSELLSSYSSSSESSNPGKVVEDGIAARILAKSRHDRKSILEIVDEFLSKQHEMFAVHCAVMGDERVLTLAPHLNNVLHVARNHSKSCGQDLISVEHLMLALYADDRFGLPFYRRLQLNETDLKDAFPRVRRGEGSADRGNSARASCGSVFLSTAFANYFAFLTSITYIQFFLIVPVLPELPKEDEEQTIRPPGGHICN
ncbi:hypothetical protein RJ640_001021 [Escallonia rubra]|uniref:Clp R domain-containing protein n=1 Tax=Escallonia rubra TaxID=112253 RepID=A0AA88QR46_9ASTE|nr:hypothetical protein RJ640_001021 [Escallonia rubra]